MGDSGTSLFWGAVQQGPEGSCWPWLRSRTKGGYGTVRFRGRRTTAHRVAYELAKGEIPKGHYVLHKCDNPLCCNPKHLFTGTQKDNMADMHSKGRAGDCRNFGEKHGRCKLSDADVRTMVSLRSKGLTQDALAAHFGIAQSHVGRILRGENRAKSLNRSNP